MKRLLSVLALAALPLGLLAVPATAADFDSTVHLVKDSTPGAQVSGAFDGIRLGSRLLYSYENVVNGLELWVTDGSKAGTHLVKDIVPGAGSSEPTDFTLFGGKVYFRATDAAHGNELWVTDGTLVGTKMYKDLQPGPTGSRVGEKQIVAIGSTLYFGAYLVSGPNAGGQLWKTDGVPAHTSVVAVIKATDGTTQLSNLTRWGNRLAFAAKDDLGIEPWVTNGSTTVMVRDINAGGGDSNPTAFTVLGANLFFTAKPTGNSGPTQIWHSNAPVGNLVTAFPITPSVAINGPGNLVVNGSTLWFTADSGSVGYELWKSDGTDGGTVLAKDINPSPGISSNIQDTPTRFAGSLYFSANDSTNSGELWKANDAGVTKVKEINTDVNTGSYPTDFVAVGPQLFFEARGIGTGFELFVTDGTTAGTKLVKDISPGLADSSPRLLGAVGSTLFLAAYTPATGEELWAFTTKASTTKAYPKSSYTKKAAAKKKIRVTIKVRATGTTPTGKIYLKQGTKVVGVGILKNGNASIRITKAWGKGTHNVRAYYTGSVYARVSNSTLIHIKVG